MRLQLLNGLATPEQRAVVLRKVVERLYQNNRADARLPRIYTQQLADSMPMLTLDEIDFAADTLSRVLAGHPTEETAQ